MYLQSKRLALAAATVVAALGAAGPAYAHDPGDDAVVDPVGFALNPATLEPGCYPGWSLATSHVDVTQIGGEVHIALPWDASFSVDQALIPSLSAPGYQVYNTFDTGTNENDEDIDHLQSAGDMTGPGGSDADPNGVIVCISDHPDRDQNEPYVQDGLPGEVAVLNRPIIQPQVAALGVSAIGPLHTYKVGFGYSVEQRYDLTWFDKFLSGGDPMAGPAFGSVTVPARAEEAGVRRFNDIDQFGEEFASGPEISNYGQPDEFDLTGSGDPFAYLHAPGALLTFTTQGDLPISWSVKPSLAPESYARTATLTDDELRAWDKAWQNYYAGKGAKPALPLAPGTNSPAPDPAITVIVNLPEQRTGTEPQKAVLSTTNNSTTIYQVAPQPQPKPSPAKAAVAARLMKSGSKRAVQLFVSSSAKTEKIRIRLFSKGHMVGSASKTVATNKFVKVSGLKVAKKVTSVKADVIR